MINQKQVVPGALAALAVGTLVHKARRDRRSHARTHAFCRTRGRRHC